MIVCRDLLRLRRARRSALGDNGSKAGRLVSGLTHGRLTHPARRKYLGGRLASWRAARASCRTATSCRPPV
jgi:hypothetical protein